LRIFAVKMDRPRWSAAVIGFACAVTVFAARSETSSPPPLFSSARMLRVRIEAPLASLFSSTSAAKAGSQRKDPGPARSGRTRNVAKTADNAKPHDEDVAGTLSYEDDSNQTIVLPDVRFSLRGHTSLDPTECTFPKLSATLEPGEALDRSIFRGLKSIKIGTHCGERGDGERSPKGRLANDKAPLREAFVYRLLDTLGVTTLKARPAEITYIDGHETRRHAMLLEDVDATAARLGAGKEIDKSKFTNARDMFDPDLAVKLAFGEALIGNFDWCVKWTVDDTYRCDARRILWNVVALARPNGRAIPLPYDFDIAGMVNGSHGWFPQVYDESFPGTRSRADVEVLGQVGRTRLLFTRVQLDRARKEFMARRNAAYRALDETELDPEGRSIIKNYMDAFFAAIDRDDAFYRQVVVAASTPAFADEQRTRRACAVDVPEGTVVAEVDRGGGAGAAAAVKTSGATTTAQTVTSMAHVRLLDVQWRWAQNRSCDGLRQNAVWIARTALGTEFPAR